MERYHCDTLVDGSEPIYAVKFLKYPEASFPEVTVVDSNGNEIKTQEVEIIESAFVSEEKQGDDTIFTYMFSVGIVFLADIEDYYAEFLCTQKQPTGVFY